MKAGKKNVILLTICLGALIGCSNADENATEELKYTETTEEAVTVGTGEIAAEDADISDIVWQEAEAWTIEEYEYYKRVSAGSNYSDWRIESLAHCYTYEDFEGMVLQVYRMNIEFLSETPEGVFLMGGMTMTEDGWVTPDYANSRYLVFRQDKETLTLLTRMFENDCYAGDDTFTKDLKHRWELQKQPEDTPTLTFTEESSIQ